MQKILQKQIFILLVFLLTILLAPASTRAETVIDSRLITKSEIWKSSDGIYRIQGDIVIEKGATVSINSAKDIFLDAGTLQVFGNLLINASSTQSANKTNIHFGPNFQVPQIKSGLFEINNSVIQECKSLAEVYNQGTFHIFNSTVSDCTDHRPLVGAWNSSSVFVGNTKFTNISAPSVIEVFLKSTLVVNDTLFENSGTDSAISVHDNYASADIEYSEFKNSRSAGIQSFNNSILTVTGSLFSSVKTGLLLFSNVHSEVLNNSFTGNNIGIESYNASTTASGNSFEFNTEYAALVSDSTFNADRNWWGNSSGPHHIQKNTNGTGDRTEGELSLAPWLLEKPNNTKCCSSVIFFPGFEGSRLYSRGVFFENQLWEPNRESDVKKLFTNKDGNSINKGVYTRDIIQTTNIGLGFFDKDIYKEFTDYLKGLKNKKNIQDYKIIPYDWRYNSDTLVQKNKEAWIKQIIESASVSKTKKVVLVGHSFGTLLIKKILLELKSSGKSNLIDSVVFIGSPEQGAFESVLSVLHGDGHGIGHGTILSQAVARSFAQNLSSVYELFPKNDLADSFMGGEGDFSNQPFFKIMKTPKSGPLLAELVKNYEASDSGTYQFSGIQDLEDFVFAKGKQLGRVSPGSPLDLRSPSVGNGVLYQSHPNLLIKKPLDTADLGIPGRLYNILGTGLPTISGLEYSEKCFTGGNGPAVPLIWSLGAVRAQCLLDRAPLYSNSGDGIVPLGNLSLRPGAKIIINLLEHNSVHSTNIKHADLVSSDPIITILNTILFKNKLSLAESSSVRTIKDYVQENGSASEPPIIEGPTDPFNGSGTRAEYFRIKISSKDPITIEDQKGNLLQDFSIGESFTVQNKIQGASYMQVGDARFVLLKEIPKTLRVDGKNFGTVHISIDKVLNQESNSSVADTSSPVYIFPNIPIAPQSKITVSFASTTPVAEVNSGLLTGGSIEIINPIVLLETTKDPKYSIEEIKEEIRRVKREIRKSILRLKFQDRYINKADALLRKIESYPVVKSQNYSVKVQESLAAIISETQEDKSRFYRGGMSVGEASYLYIKFFNIYKMYTFLEV